VAAVAAVAAAAEVIGAGLTACRPGVLTATATSLWNRQAQAHETYGCSWFAPHEEVATACNFSPRTVSRRRQGRELHDQGQARAGQRIEAWLHLAFRRGLLQGANGS